MLENFSCVSLILPFAFYETINNKSGKCYIIISRPLFSPSSCLKIEENNLLFFSSG